MQTVEERQGLVEELGADLFIMNSVSVSRGA